MLIKYYNNNNLIDKFFEEFYKLDKKSNVWDYNTSVEETEDMFLVSIVLPGFKKENISIKLERNELIVNAEKRNSTSKISLSDEFKEKYKLPETVDQNNIEATYESGILTITIGKNKKKDKIKMIEIK